MSKLLSVLIAGIFATVATTGYAQDKKAADAPKAEMKKDGVKKADKTAKKAKKAKKDKAAMAKDAAPKK